MTTISLALAACAPKIAGDRHATASSTSDPSTHVVDAGARGPADSENCVKVVVGSRREDALLCDEIDSGYWRTTHQVVRVVRAGRSVPVLDVLTKIEGDDSGAIMLALRLRIAADGLAATLDGVPITVDGPPATQPGPLEDCDSASDWKDSEIERQNGVTRYRDLRRRLCGARGTYKWNGGRFQQAPLSN